MVDLQKIADELEFDLDDVEMLMAVFTENAKETLEWMKKSIIAKDFEAIAKSAHKIKGSSANILLKEISQISSEIERSAKERLDIDYNSKINELESMIDELG